MRGLDCYWFIVNSKLEIDTRRFMVQENGNGNGNGRKIEVSIPRDLNERLQSEMISRKL